MALFQKSVVSKFLRGLDQNSVDSAYEKFKTIYSNQEKLDNIRLSKEEQYQEGFLREIFVDVLGYTINPEPDYNLTSEFKNETDAKKADGAILRDKKAIAVIELKSTKTKNLDDVKQQAFYYKNNQSSCRYVITSNYEFLWFYVDDATDHDEFNLFDMSFDEFKFFYLLLNKDSIFDDVPAKMKTESKLKEEDITKVLYRDYSQFKRKLFDNLVKLNPEYDKLTLLKKSQKLLDRLLFIFFAEDKGLIPPNTISKIIEEYNQLKTLDAYQTIFSIFVKYFKYIDEGTVRDAFTMPAYNGELFKPDEILDNPNLKINDDLLIHDTVKLSRYDFDTEVDVNILGHIFEHSLNEIEALQAEIKGEKFDTKTSKRKKDGVFYTPKFITKYIVDSTLGKLCEEKKTELGINEMELDESFRYRKEKGFTAKTQAMYDKLIAYREYILSLKICDPACGSGAFLNQALTFLIEEHEWIDHNRKILERQDERFGGYDIETSILENNLYGVDINEEAVEIAKLSLWLRTAKRGRKLSNLNDKIKCGNSLIDDPEVAGDKAFNWFSEFPEVFPGYRDYDAEAKEREKKKNQQTYLIRREHPDIQEIRERRLQEPSYEYPENKPKSMFVKSPSYSYKPDIKGYEKHGFDVIIGNPPYGAKLDHKDWLKKRFPETSYGNIDSYKYFINKAITLLKNFSCMSFITNDSFLEKEYFLDLRKYIYKNSSKIIIVKLGDNVFPEVNLPTAIIINRNETSLQTEIASIDISNNKDQVNKSKILLSSNTFSIIPLNSNYSFTKIKEIIRREGCSKLIEVYEQVMGVKIYQKGKGKPKQTNDEKENDVFVSKIAMNKNYLKLIDHGIERYFYHDNNIYINYGEWLAEPRESKYFINPKVIIREIVNPRIFATYYDDIAVVKNIASVIIQKREDYNLLYLLCLLNSKLLNYYVNTVSPKRKNTSYPSFTSSLIKSLPIKNITPNQQLPFIEKADIMLDKNKELHEKKDEFIEWFKSEYDIEKLSNKLKDFHDLSFNDFLSEIKKKASKDKKSISPAKRKELEGYFTDYKEQALAIKQIIDTTDKEIDQMVYELYGLTEEEIKVVEGVE